MDHVSDAFLDNLMPLLTLCEPAQAGDRDGVNRVAPRFMQHAANMQKVMEKLQRLMLVDVLQLLNICCHLKILLLGCTACLFSV